MTAEDKREFNYVLDWLADERALYQPKKFNYDKDDDDNTKEFGEKVLEDTYWYNQILQYMHRAQVLGLENKNGRQALAKMAATAVAFTESAIRIYGELPIPGVTSGENLETTYPIGR